MVFKLLKYDFRATAPSVLLLWAGLLILSGLSALFGALCSSLDIFYLPMLLSTLLFAVLAIASVVIVYILMIRRFYRNIYSNEGYLTLTLPVRRGSVIWSKLICSVVWVIGTFAVLMLSGMILILSDTTNSFMSVLADTLLIAEWMIKFIDLRIWVIAAELSAFGLVSLFKSILILYAAVSIGQLFKRHRILGSFVGYGIVSIIGRIVESVYSWLMGLSSLSIDFTRQMYSGHLLDQTVLFNIQVSLIVYIVLSAIFAAVLFMFTELVMRRHVNLQ